MIRFDNILEKVRYFSEKDTTFLRKAYVFAAQSHKGQVRRSGEPYLSHPLEVTSMLADMKLDVTTLAAGLLHDVLEDTDVTAEDLQKIFGKETADLVEGVTKISLVQISSPETRKAETIRKIIIAMTDDLRVVFIKLADRIHNLKTLKYLPEEKQRRIAQETLDLYAPIANRLGMGRIKAELEDLSFRYVDPENFFKIASLVDPMRKKAEKELKTLKKKIEGLLAENNIPGELFHRLKRPYSVFNKMIRQEVDFDQVYDFMALRILTDSVKNCYAGLGIVHQKWPHIPHRFRDYIAMPKPNLYQALHTTIITSQKQTIEIQFRTHEMHDLAENGIAAHWKYKEADPLAFLKEDKRLLWLREAAELYKEQKNPREFLKSLKTDLIPEEVYAFTPMGKVLSLPMGASALDFAFRIHSEIGLHATGTKINGRAAPLKTILKTGDIVEVFSSPQKKPNRSWLNMAFTSTARHHIKRWLNLQDKQKKTALGNKLWEKQAQAHRLPAAALKNKELQNRLAHAFHASISSPEDFFYAVGSGKIVVNRQLLDNFFLGTMPHGERTPIIYKVATRVAQKSAPVIKIKDGDDPQISLAKCCSPIRGEPVIGYITSGKGISVHSLRCPLVTKERLDYQRMVDISWGGPSRRRYQGKLLIMSDDSPGVLARLTAVIANLDGNITKAEVNTFSNRKARIKLILKIKDLNHLKKIIRGISEIKETSSVERI